MKRGRWIACLLPLLAVCRPEAAGAEYAAFAAAVGTVRSTVAVGTSPPTETEVTVAPELFVRKMVSCDIRW